MKRQTDVTAAIGRREALAIGAGLLLAHRPVRAAGKPLRVGVLTDMNGVYSDYLGAGSVIGAQLGVEDYGGVLGDRTIEVLTGDHQNLPDIGLAIARQWMDTQGVDAIADLTNSAVALAVCHLVAQRNKVALVTGAGSSAVTGPDCTPNTVHWTYDNWAISHSLPKGLIAQGGKKWFFVIPDYASGYDIEREATAAVKAAGGTVVGGVRHPLGAADMSSYILQASSSGADVVGLGSAGGDVDNFVKQAAEFGLTQKQKVAAFNLIANNVVGLGLPATHGLVTTESFYWNMDEGKRTWSRRFAARHPRQNMPNQMQAGAGAAIVHFLKAAASLGASDDGAAVVREMKRIPTEDALFGQGSIRVDGRTLHTMYIFQVKQPAESGSRWDVYNQLSAVPGDLAFRPLHDGNCPLVKL